MSLSSITTSTQLCWHFRMSCIPILLFCVGILWIYFENWLLMYDLPYEAVEQHPPKRSKDVQRYCNFHSSPPVLPKCLLNNTYCGDWSIQNRTFHPAKAFGTNQSECSFRLFTPQEARQCVGKRTLVFLGDSQNRDLSIAIGLFLQGRTVEESYDHKYEGPFQAFRGRFQDELDGLYEPINDLEKWGPLGSRLSWILPATNQTLNHRWKFLIEHNVTSKYNKYRNESSSYDFQVLFIPSLKTEDRLVVEDIISGVFLEDPVAKNIGLRGIDLLIWSYGLHDKTLWHYEPYDESYFQSILSNFVDLIPKSKYPIVWSSMNSQCHRKTVVFGNQSTMINTVNQRIGVKMKLNHLPYYDADYVLRTPDICNISHDGVHVKMWVDLVRARMFFNYLCDEHNNWVLDTNLSSFLL